MCASEVTIGEGDFTPQNVFILVRYPGVRETQAYACTPNGNGVCIGSWYYYVHNGRVPPERMARLVLKITDYKNRCATGKAWNTGGAEHLPGACS
jgi:hypothetical protein